MIGTEKKINIQKLRDTEVRNSGIHAIIQWKHNSYAIKM